MPPRSNTEYVDKTLRLGTRGGVFYINTAGRRVYLKQYQRAQCLRHHSLPGDANEACAKLIARDAPTHGPFFIPRYGRIVRK